MTSGSPYRLIISFTLPMLLGNIFQQLYNMVDSIVVGNVIGDQALAAVGTGFPIIYMLSSLFMGIGTGATVMIDRQPPGCGGAGPQHRAGAGGKPGAQRPVGGDSLGK